MSLIAYPWLASALTRNPLLIAGGRAGATPAVAGVHLARRRDHRSRRSQEGDGRWPTSPLRAHTDRRPRSAQPPVEPAGPRRARRASRARRPVCTSSCSSPRSCSAPPRCCATTAARRSCRRSSRSDQLEKANGRMWSAEQIANTFIGPPLGSLLLIAAFSLPFFVDAASFFVAAMLDLVDPRQLPRRTARRPRAGAVEDGACRRLPVAVGQRPAALDVHHPRIHEPGLDAQRLGAGALRPGGARRRPVRVHDHGLRLRGRRGDRRNPCTVDVEAASAAARAWR